MPDFPMPDLNKLIFHVSDALEKREEPPEEADLRNLVKAHASVLELTEGAPYTPAQIEEAMRRLQTEFTTRMGLGTLFQAEDYRPWLAAEQGKIDPYYWTRYKKHLRREGLSKHVVLTLDSVTDEILDHLENPKKDGQWARKGLVVGHVQSGKTANYTGLVAKAADAGYKVIIVLAGTLNSLRNQTQERTDSDFMGWCTIKRVPIGAAHFGAERRPVCLTTAKEDFNKTRATSSMQLAALREPVMLVIKKNPSTLANLHEWLLGNNRHDLKDFPMLLIDDEADHASINTNKPEADPTTINRWIRDVLALFPRCSFVGYTATPFANIFIDPENEDEMTTGDLYRDLFPRDFILSLDPPTNYVGASQLFLEEGKLNCIRDITDNGDRLPTGHKITFIPQLLPLSLLKAIDSFIIAKTIRALRKQSGKSHSMMINVSRFTGVQNLLMNLVLDEVKRSRQAVGNYAALAVKAALQNSVLRRLHDVWTEEYRSTEFRWSEIQARLKESIDPVEVISINTKGSGILDYSKDNYPNGRTVIAVGGLSLSRGLTLQGLITNYFLRNSIMYDTLMQMGRWFGYRDGYSDLCRIYMTPDASSWYAHIAEAIEELRSDFKDMKAARMTPLEFGLRVRSHPTALIVTARNKMRASKEIPVSIALEGRLAETSVLLGNQEIIDDNKRVLEALVKSAMAVKLPERHTLGWIWKDLPSSLAKAVITGFRNHPVCILTTAQPLLEYISWLEQNGQNKFDFLLRSNGEGDFSAGGLKINPIERTVMNPTPQRIEFNKRRVASRGDERAGLSDAEIAAVKASYEAAYPGKDVPDKEYRKFRQRSGRPPLLMAIFTKIIAKEDKTKTNIVAAYGIGFPGDPGSQRRAKKLVQYRVNTVWWEMNVPDVEEEEDSE
jgi:hypothetical protein